MEKPALGIPIIIVTIFLFMSGYVYFVTSTTKPEGPPAPPAASIAGTPKEAAPLQEPDAGDVAGLSQAGILEVNEVKTWTGRFAGFVDDSLLVIYVGDEAKTFLAAPGFTGAGLVKGDSVSFDFFLDKNGQPVLSSIRKLVPSE